MTITTRVNRRTSGTIALGVGSVIAGTFAVGAGAEQADAGVTPWTRNNAYNFGLTGIAERYCCADTGNSMWIDDDLRLPPHPWAAYEAGADCSGYVGKSWQMANTAHNSNTNNTIYPSSGDWHATGGNAQNQGAIHIPMNDARTRRADAWAYPGHMGMFEGTTNAGGQWKIWHAASESIGIAVAHQPDSYFVNSGARRFKRGNW